MLSVVGKIGENYDLLAWETEFKMVLFTQTRNTEG